eukprot:jgi/Ulvmu1/774/UM010_0148.1
MTAAVPCAVQTLNCGERGQPCCAGATNDDFCTTNAPFSGTPLRCSSDDGRGTCESCGGDGEPCCQRSPFDTPSCARGNRCAAGACKACGERGEPCCAGSTNKDFCAASDRVTGNLRCSDARGNGTCVSCGGFGEPCCQVLPTDAPWCARGNRCDTGVCRVCGERGEPCCTGRSSADFCFATSNSNLLRCSDARGNGTCVSCGGDGEPCCQRLATDTPSCASGYRCTPEGCIACGERGEPCCEGSSNREFCSAVTLSNPLVCSSSSGNGTCMECGGAGQRCCQPRPTDDAICMAGECSGGRCPASPAQEEGCGERGQPCCPGSSNNARCPSGASLRCSSASGDGRCEACGGAGEPCCQVLTTSDLSCDTGNVCTAADVCEPCGERGELCCDGRNNVDLCPAGINLFCDGPSGTGRCASCGGIGEPCCQRRFADDPFCDALLACIDGECMPCGERGERCCEGRRNADACPDGNNLRCASAPGGSRCEACGGAGEPCCQRTLTSRLACDADHTCHEGMCEPCGERGERCCNQSPVLRRNAEFCSGGITLRCSSEAGNGTCISCGGFGEPCCDRFSSGRPTCDRGISCTDAGCCGTEDCSVGDDACPEDPEKTRPGRCGCGVPETAGCGLPDPDAGSAGDTAVGICVDASGSLTEAEFNSVREQVIAFIDASSNANASTGANGNMFYVAAFGASVSVSTGSFLTNTDRRVSRLVAQRIVYRGDSTVNLTVALDDLAARFAALTAPATASAVVLTGRTSPAAAASAAAQRVESSFSGRVAVAAVALTPQASVATLEAFASTSVSGRPLVSQTSDFSQLPSLLATSITSAGGTAIAIALDASSSISQEEFETARAQIVAFIDASSGVGTAAGINRNIYYVASFASTVRGSTGLFLSNADHAVSRLVAQQLTPASRGGTINLAAGLNDLTAQLRTLTAPLPALAVLVAAGSSSRTAAAGAADSLRGSGDAVTLACVALGSAANVATLDAIASTGVNDTRLSLESPFSLIGLSLQLLLDARDVDGDGTVDAKDECPADAAKTEAGRCGCGLPEATPCAAR